MKKKRVFIGTFLKTPEIIELYPKLKSGFKNIIEGKWVEDWNLHFTYHFIGEIEEVVIKDLLIDLKQILIEFNDPLKMVGLGCFPNLNYPRVLFIQIIDRTKILNEIYNYCKNILIRHNIPVENRPFHPHLTLLRIKSVKRNEFTNMVQNYSKTNFGKVENFFVNLIESKLTPKGPIYNVILNE